MWCLTTVVRDSPDRYTDEILPLTEPLFIDYAERWGMDYRPTWISRSDEEGFERIRTRGTQAVYASIPKRLGLLRRYEGIVYIDEDAVIVDPEEDLRAFVNPYQPVAMPEGLTAAVQVLLSTSFTRRLLEDCWAEREHWVNFHWAEEGYFKARFGWDHWYEHGDPAKFVKATPDTRKLVQIPKLVVAHPGDPEGLTAAIINPGGIHPLERRLQLVKEAIGRRDARALRG